MKPIAIVLSGCGVFDGSEVYETVCTLLAIQALGFSYQCMAPNIEQNTVMNHFTHKAMDEKRNVLVEAARLARGNIVDLSTANPEDFSAAIYPGGFGVVMNLSNFAEKMEECIVENTVLHFAKAMANAKKPQGFLCISPVLISKIYGPGVTLTVGDDLPTIDMVEKMGAKHQVCAATEVAIDATHKVVSTPCYMSAKQIGEIATGTNALVKALIALF